MQALSVQQPWADLIVTGQKDIENRTWSTKYRGRLWIHASKKFDKEGYEWLRENTDGRLLRTPDYYTKGAIVGSVTLADCVQQHDSNWFFGPYGFVLENPKPFIVPIPYKGKLKIFNVPAVFSSNIRYGGGRPKLDITVKSGDKVFAPTWDMVSGFDLTLDWEQYQAQYRALMRRSYKEHHSRWQEVLSLDEVVLLCYCRRDKYCHRQLLRQYLTKCGAVDCGEIPLVKKGDDDETQTPNHNKGTRRQEL